MNKTKREHRQRIIEKIAHAKQELDNLMIGEIATPSQEEMDRYDELQRRIANYYEILNSFFSTKEEEDKFKREWPLY